MRRPGKASLALALLALAVPWPAAADTPISGTTSLTVGFNGTPIPAGSTLWFNSILKPSFPAGTSGLVTIFLKDVTLTLTPKGGTPVTYTVPDAHILYSPSVTVATTTYHTDTNTFCTQVPASFRDNVFLTGLALPLPQGFPPGASATFCGTFSTDAPGVKVQYQCAAAVYKQFSSDDYNALGIKPTHGGPDGYSGGDQAGTPEDFARLSKNVIGGGTGGGGGNYTGSYSATVSLVPPAEPPAPTTFNVSGSVTTAGSSTAAIPGAPVQLLQNGTVLQTTQTGPDGGYSFTGVPSGTYTVQASAPEYNANASSAFTVSSGSVAVPVLPLTPLAIGVLSDPELHGKLFFSASYGTLATTGTTLSDANEFADLKNPTYASLDLSTAYRYVGFIPDFPELGHFGDAGEPEIFVIIQQPLVEPTVYTASFSNQVGVLPGTGAVGTAEPYTYRFQFSTPFTGPGTAHNYTLTGVQLTTGAGSTEAGSLFTPPSVAPSDGSSAPPPPSGDVPPGFMATALAQITLPPAVTADVSVNGSYTDVSGQVFSFDLTSSLGGGPAAAAEVVVAD